MDFKVGVSLWAHSPGTGLSEAPGTEDDFMSHLRQDQQAVSSGQKNLNESFHKELPQGSEQKLPLGSKADEFSLHRAHGRDSNTMAELYPLGLMAGAHLSYLGDSLVQSVGQLRYSEHQSSGSSAGPGNSARQQHEAVVVTRREQLFQVATPSYRAEQSAGLASSTTQAAGVSARLAKIWPERHLLLLPKDRGIELVIRDYHLTKEDVNLLVKELQDSGSTAEQLWVNGKRVWQRANPSFGQGVSGNGN